MKILTLESSSLSASVCVTEDTKLLAQSFQNCGLTHSATLLPMIDHVMAASQLTMDDIDAVAAVTGPGSFTGIRIGVSTVKGLAWAADKPCVGVSTLEAMAWHGLAAGGLVCPVMDARRSQVYNALFKVENGRPVRLCEDRPIALSQLAEELRDLNAPAFLIGDGAELAEKYLREQGLACTVAPENLRWQSAWGVAMAAMDKTPGNADALLPVYLRLSQAERERQERLAKEAEQ